MENKGLRVNMKKTRILISGSGLDLLKSFDKFPWEVCCKGVGVSTQLGVLHANCSELSKWLSADPLYVY